MPTPPPPPPSRRSVGNDIRAVKYCIRAMNYKLNFNRIEPILWCDSSGTLMQNRIPTRRTDEKTVYCSRLGRTQWLINAAAWLIYARIRDIIFIEIRNPNENVTVAAALYGYGAGLCVIATLSPTIGTSAELTLEFINNNSSTTATTTAMQKTTTRKIQFISLAKQSNGRAHSPHYGIMAKCRIEMNQTESDRYIVVRFVGFVINFWPIDSDEIRNWIELFWKAVLRGVPSTMCSTSFLVTGLQSMNFLSIKWSIWCAKIYQSFSEAWIINSKNPSQKFNVLRVQNVLVHFWEHFCTLVFAYEVLIASFSLWFFKLRATKSVGHNGNDNDNNRSRKNVRVDSYFPHDGINLSHGIRQGVEWTNRLRSSMTVRAQIGTGCN